MKRKTAIKKLMGLGVSRNYANYYLDTMHYVVDATNKDAITFFDIYRDKWSRVLFNLTKSKLIAEEANKVEQGLE